jgi:hypothetical protein
MTSHKPPSRALDAARVIRDKDEMGFFHLGGRKSAMARTNFKDISDCCAGILRRGS